MRANRPLAGKKVVERFKEKEAFAIDVILEHILELTEIGIFGSYARNTYTTLSDIDILVVAKERTPRTIRGSIRDELSLLDVDVHFVSEDYFMNSTDNFMRKVREDYIRRVYCFKRIVSS